MPGINNIYREKG